MSEVFKVRSQDDLEEIEKGFFNKILKYTLTKIYNFHSSNHFQFYCSLYKK